MKLMLALSPICSFEDGLKLVQLRGESMQAASDASPSGMVSVIGLDAEKVRQAFGILGAVCLLITTMSSSEISI
jgi:malonyl CoA-acyl carrier protein transacylase